MQSRSTKRKDGSAVSKESRTTAWAIEAGFSNEKIASTTTVLARGKLDGNAKLGVESGRPLSEALGRRKSLLGETLVTTVKLGEHSGELDQSFADARHHYRRMITRTQNTLADLLVPCGVFVGGSIALLTWLATFGSFIAIGDGIIASM